MTIKHTVGFHKPAQSIFSFPQLGVRRCLCASEMHTNNSIIDTCQSCKLNIHFA